MQTKQQNLPIGYWIKKADEQLTTSINEIHKSANLSRLGWQIMHTIHEHGTIKNSELIEIARPFASENEVEKILGNFSIEGLITLKDEAKLTDKGKQLYQQCLEKQQQIRQQAMNGISEQEYKITIQTLQKIVANLENT
jgi:DNA-binding MarR family transcriptional regulator